MVQWLTRPPDNSSVTFVLSSIAALLYYSYLHSLYFVEHVFSPLIFSNFFEPYLCPELKINHCHMHSYTRPRKA